MVQKFGAKFEDNSLLKAEKIEEVNDDESKMLKEQVDIQKKQTIDKRKEIIKKDKLLR